MSETLEASAPPAMAPVKGGVVAYLSVDGAVKAAELYKTALGAEIAAMHPPDEKGRTMHVHLYINGSSVMLADFYEEHGHGYEKPSAFNLTLMSTDIERDFKRAADAGFEPVMPPTKMFWGDMYAQLKDPFGVAWSINQGA